MSSRRKKKSWEEKGWGAWGAGNKDAVHIPGIDNPGMVKRREVQQRLGIGEFAGTEGVIARETRLRRGDVETMDEYHEAQEKGWDKGWGEDGPEINGMGVLKKKKPGLLDRTPISQMPQRVTAKPIRTPAYYVNRGGTLVPVYDEDDDIYNVSSYSDAGYYDRYGFGGRLGGGYGGGKYLSDDERSRANRYKDGLSDSYDSWGAANAEYRKTGVWQGYSAYRTPTLSYRYVEQMANVLAAHYDITINPGDAWEVDIENKKLTYNPLSLISGTKADLLLTLLHEIGHIVNTTPNDKLKGDKPFIYSDPIGKALFELPSIFEDLRNDTIMQENYDGAQEIYDTAQEAPVRALAERMFKTAEAVRQFWIQEEHRFIEEMNASMLSLRQQMTANPQDEAKIKKSIVSIVDDAFRTTSTEDMKDVVEKYRGTIEEEDVDRMKRSELPNAFDYAGHMLLHAYGYAPKKADKIAEKYAEDILPYIEDTKGSLSGFKTAKTTQDLFDKMQEEVTPKIADLIDRVQLPPTLKDKVSPRAAAKMRQNMGNRMQMAQETQGAGEGKIRGAAGQKSGPGTELPSDWLDGDYNSMRDSVKNEIRTLERFLQNIRREEQAIKMTRYEKRGKLDSRRLYSFATGSTRLFKRKLPSVDTVRSFAFSVIIDTSGSMSGSRIVNSTRAAIAFAEAFEKVGIPMEIMRFDSGAQIIKDFDVERMDKAQKGKIGGLVQSSGGSTNVDRAFDMTKITKRTERNRIIIVITDGGVGDSAFIKQRYVDELKKQGIQTYGYALDGYGPDIEAMCEVGKGINLKSPAEMIPHFMDLLKKLMKTARRDMMSVKR